MKFSSKFNEELIERFKRKRIFMPIIRKPESFIIGKTVPKSVPTPTGIRYDLSPYLRVDLTARIRARSELHYLLGEETTDNMRPLNVINFPVQSNTSDFVLEKVFRTAWEFGYIDEDTYITKGKYKYVDKNGWDRELYERGLRFGWYSSYLILHLKKNDNFCPEEPVKINPKLKTNYAELFEPKEDMMSEEDIKIMEIACREGLIKSLLRKLSKSLPSQNSNIIWMGDLYNFMPIFRLDPKNPSPGWIDDRLDPIESLRINAAGFFILEYKNRGRIDLNRLKYAAMVGAICQNVPYLELNFIK